MSVILIVNGSEIRALGPIKLIYDRDGSIRLKLGAEYSATVKMFDTIELWDGIDRLFIGKVRGPVFNEAGGIQTIEAWDWKGWMKEIPYFGLSSQCGASRHARVKYAYNAGTETTALPIWNVGSLIDNIIDNACNNSDDSLPDLWDVLPEEYKADWYGQSTFSADSGLSDIQPFGHQFDGASVAGAITQILGKYFPAYGWWIDPGLTMPPPGGTDPPPPRPVP